MALDQDYLSELTAKIKGVFSRNSASAVTKDTAGGYNQLIGQVLAFIVFVALAIWVIDQVRVDGPVYNTLTQYQDIRSEVAPPVLYPVEAYADLNEAYFATLSNDVAKRDAKVAACKAAEQKFKSRIDYWRSNLKDKDLASKLESVSKTSTSFFEAANTSFIPALLSGPEAATSQLNQLANAYADNKKSVDLFLSDLDKSSKAQIASQSDFVNQIFIALIGMALLILVFTVIFGLRQVKAVQAGVKKLADDAEQNQVAVLKLLDEMGDLADGDLTVKAEVTDTITGAIADSINYTIDSLRDLVQEINRATVQVNTATSQAQNTSVALLAAAEQQANQINETGEAIRNMTRSILHVSSNAGQASEVAQRSLKAATQGSLAVQNTISGMNDIRTQIQETSKRIKRLGESSQEISEIVELISDITEQTNILALNAAIQAASAGEAGRGFTVVAEEVQRLAERSSEATKQISSIVRTIQTDTNSAVAAMEKSTEGVVDGAKLSDAAGKALNEIETVTTNLARLIQAISEATAAQTESASVVTRNMQEIQNITSQTTEGTKLTAESVGQLNNLAEELRASVAGFKLS